MKDEERNIADRARMNATVARSVGVSNPVAGTHNDTEMYIDRLVTEIASLRSSESDLLKEVSRLKRCLRVIRAADGDGNRTVTDLVNQALQGYRL